MIKVLTFLTIMIVVSGCATSPQSQEYPFKYKAATGISTYVVCDDKEVPIRYTSDSDPVALKALFALRWRVLYTTGSGTELKLIGVLNPVPKPPPTGKHFAQTQACHDFNLRDWYVTTPFESIVGQEGSGDTRVVPRSRLEASDFRSPQDPTRWQRRRQHATPTAAE
jgi:hypothetical protein